MSSRYSLATLAVLAILTASAMPGRVSADPAHELTLKTAGDREWPEGVEANLRTLIDLSRYPCRPGPGQKALIQRQVRDNSRAALQALGFYQPVLTPQWRDADDERCFALTLTVDPGVAVEGDVQGADAGGLAGVHGEGQGEAALVVGVAPLRR